MPLSTEGALTTHATMHGAHWSKQRSICSSESQHETSVEVLVRVSVDTWSAAVASAWVMLELQIATQRRRRRNMVGEVFCGVTKCHKKSNPLKRNPLENKIESVGYIGSTLTNLRRDALCSTQRSQLRTTNATDPIVLDSRKETVKDRCTITYEREQIVNPNLLKTVSIFCCF